MKKIIIALVLLAQFKLSSAQFLIQSSIPVDVCYPATVSIWVVSPQASYNYTWFLGGYGCPTYSSVPYAGGTSMTALITGEFYCVATPIAGGSGQFSNPIKVRVLPGMPGSVLLPAPGLYSGGSMCAPVSLCIPEIYYVGWGTIINWYKDNVLIIGASSGNYTATAEGSYKYSITSGCMTAFSDITVVSTVPTVSLTAGGPTTICSGGSVILYAGSALTNSYQWKKNGISIPGATGISYTATVSGSYTVVVSNSCGTVTSTTIVVTVNPLPTASITPAGPTTFCSGGSVVLNANTGAGLSYQWKKDGLNIPSATGNSYIATATGGYTVVVSNSCGPVTSAPVVVTVPSSIPSVPGTITGPSTFCSNQTGVAYSIASIAGASVYNWLVPTGATVASGQGTTSIIVNFGTKSGKIRVNAGNVCGNSSYKSKNVSKNCREGIIASGNEFEVTVFPNPSSGDFIFKCSNASNEKISVTIYDQIGKLIFTEDISNSTLTIPNLPLPAGVYTALITNGENKKVLKLVKTNFIR